MIFSDPETVTSVAATGGFQPTRPPRVIPAAKAMVAIMRRDGFSLGTANFPVIISGENTRHMAFWGNDHVPQAAMSRRLCDIGGRDATKTVCHAVFFKELFQFAKTLLIGFLE